MGVREAPCVVRYSHWRRRGEVLTACEIAKTIQWTWNFAGKLLERGTAAWDTSEAWRATANMEAAVGDSRICLPDRFEVLSRPARKLLVWGASNMVQHRYSRKHTPGNLHSDAPSQSLRQGLYVLPVGSYLIETDEDHSPGQLKLYLRTWYFKTLLLLPCWCAAEVTVTIPVTELACRGYREQWSKCIVFTLKCPTYSVPFLCACMYVPHCMCMYIYTCDAL